MKKNIFGFVAATALLACASSSFALVGKVSMAGMNKGLGYHVQVNTLDPSYDPMGAFETECASPFGPILGLDEIDGENKEIINVIQTSVLSGTPVNMGYDLRPHKDDPTGPDQCFIAWAYLIAS